MTPAELMHLRTLVVGCGVTGASVVRYLHAAGVPFEVVDDAAGPEAAPGGTARKVARALEANGGTSAGEVGGIRAHDRLDAALAGAFDVIVLSPGVPRAHPAIRAALDAGASVIGDIELFASAVDAPVVAVTGSNGKSTVVAWLAHALAAAGIDAVACGNIGDPALDALARGGAALYVLELSSYQLESTGRLAPLASVVLNVSDDHLDRYASIEEYAAVKRRVHAGSRAIVLNADDARTRPVSRPVAATFSANLPADAYAGAPHRWHLAPAWLQRDGAPVLGRERLGPPGTHNALNALAVLALADIVLAELGSPEPEIAEPETAETEHDACRHALHAGIEGFAGLPHRTALVAEARGVRWYDDSKGTNVDACVKAVLAMPGPVVLIAGGIGKGADFSPLAAPAGERVRAAILIGRDAAAIEAALAGVTAVHRAGSMRAAVDLAASIARPGDAVLLSPACSSFDMFADYADRGRRFAAAATEAAETVTATAAIAVGEVPGS